MEKQMQICPQYSGMICRLIDTFKAILYDNRFYVCFLRHIAKEKNPQLYVGGFKPLSTYNLKKEVPVVFRKDPKCVEYY